MNRTLYFTEDGRRVTSFNKTKNISEWQPIETAPTHWMPLPSPPKS